MSTVICKIKCAHLRHGKNTKSKNILLSSIVQDGKKLPVLPVVQVRVEESSIVRYWDPIAPVLVHMNRENKFNL
jgi:hypothetical protein